MHVLSLQELISCFLTLSEFLRPICNCVCNSIFLTHCSFMDSNFSSISSADFSSMRTAVAVWRRGHLYNNTLVGAYICPISIGNAFLHILTLPSESGVTARFSHCERRCWKKCRFSTSLKGTSTDCAPCQLRDSRFQLLA
jgi:hypothetical protein